MLPNLHIYLLHIYLVLPFQDYSILLPSYYLARKEKLSHKIKMLFYCNQHHNHLHHYHLKENNLYIYSFFSSIDYLIIPIYIPYMRVNAYLLLCLEHYLLNSLIIICLQSIFSVCFLYFIIH